MKLDYMFTIVNNYKFTTVNYIGVTFVVFKNIMLPRYYSYKLFENYFQSIISTYGYSLNTTKIGTSVKNRPIYGIKIGTGKIKVLAWSQMHGNESTSTRAICELLKSGGVNQFLDQMQLYIIAVLNPDGAENWTRVNENKVDLNRDAIALSQPESRLLRDVFESFSPDYCFNLHGQRTIYGIEKSQAPAQLSFLAPAGDIDKTLSLARIKSMHVINTIYNQLSKDVPGKIGRYNDDFNINCVGDYIMSKNVPTILFEAGHACNDYSRDIVTALYLKALTTALKTIINLQDIMFNEKAAIVKHYNNIPQITNSYVDILIKNYKTSSGTQNLSILYHEQLDSGVLYFVPILVAINNKNDKNAHRVIDLHLLKDQFKNDLIIHGSLQVESDSLNITLFANYM